MKKIPTIFVRDMTNHGKITEEPHPACLWVFAGEGVPTIKWDGTCCRILNGVLWKRREIRPGQPIPDGFELADYDETTGKRQGWVLVGSGADDQWHREAFEGCAKTPEDGTYELIGPKVQGFPDRDNLSTVPSFDVTRHHLFIHGGMPIANHIDRTFEGIRRFLLQTIEGIVWHHPDGRMGKIKRKDFGLPWPVKP